MRFLQVRKSSHHWQWSRQWWSEVDGGLVLLSLRYSSREMRQFRRCISPGLLECRPDQEEPTVDRRSFPQWEFRQADRKAHSCAQTRRMMASRQEVPIHRFQKALTALDPISFHEYQKAWCGMRLKSRWHEPRPR